MGASEQQQQAMEMKMLLGDQGMRRRKGKTMEGLRRQHRQRREARRVDRARRCEAADAGVSSSPISSFSARACRIASLSEHLYVSTRSIYPISCFLSDACADRSGNHRIVESTRMARGSTNTQDLAKADLLIIIGTSLQVAPFCRLPSRAPPNCPRILINREAVGEFTLTERRQERYFAIQRRKEEHAAKRAGKGQQKVAGTHSGKGGSEKRSKESLTVIEGAMAKMSLGGVTAQKADNAATAGNRDKAGSTEKAAEEARKLASDIREEAVPTAPEASGTTPAITMQPTAVPSQPAEEAGKAERNAEPDVRSESDYSDDGYDDRDAFYKGDADTAMCRLAEMLGWREELEGRIDKINARLRREWTMSA